MSIPDRGPSPESYAAYAQSMQPVDYASEYRLLCKMEAHGSSFTSALASAWMLADKENAGKLRAAFGHMLARYAAAPEVQQ